MRDNLIRTRARRPRASRTLGDGTAGTADPDRRRRVSRLRHDRRVESRSFGTTSIAPTSAIACRAHAHEAPAGAAWRSALLRRTITFCSKPTNDPSSRHEWLNGTYAQRFNKRAGRWGHLCGSRYSITSDRVAAAALRRISIHRTNPVRAGSVARPQDWPWSSYAGTAGYDEPFPFVDDTRRSHILRHRRRARELLRAFVEDAVEAVTEP